MDVKLLRGGQVIPVFEQGSGTGIIDNGASAVKDDRVLEVDKFEALRNRYPQAPVIGSPRHLLIPGLVNAHHHGYGIPGYNLGCLDDTLEVWVPDPLRRRPIDLYLDTLYCDVRLLRSGVTTVLHQGYARGGLPVEEAHRAALRVHDEAGLRVAYAMGHQDQNPILYGDTRELIDALPSDAAKRLEPWIAEKLTVPFEDDYFAALKTFCVDYQGHERIRILTGPEGPEWCSPAFLTRVAEAVRELDVGIHIHVLESPIQRELGLKTGADNTMAGLERLGLLGPSTAIAHATWFNDDDMRRAADHGTTVVHNPSSNLRLRNGIAPVARMHSLGVNVALGCDSTSLNGDDDLLQEIRLAYNLHRLPGPSPLAACPSARDILRMATVNAGRPTGFGEAIGRLTPGAYADAVFIDLERLADPYLAPHLDLAHSLVMLGAHHHIDTVLVGGKVVIHAGRHVDIDQEKIRTALVASIEEQPELELVAHHLKTELRGYYQERFSGVEQRLYYAVNSRSGDG